MTAVDDAIERAEADELEPDFRMVQVDPLSQACWDRATLAAEVKRLRASIPPPDGWVQFGTHANCGDAWREFSQDVGEDGLPLWERVVTRLDTDDENLRTWREETL